MLCLIMWEAGLQHPGRPRCHPRPQQWGSAEAEQQGPEQQVAVALNVRGQGVLQFLLVHRQVREGVCELPGPSGLLLLHGDLLMEFV